MAGDSRIRILPPEVANLIAAGEVVERPASVVKELVENALDAAARSVTVEVRGGGVQSITVSDDGHGMGRDDALLALERHATSKIEGAEDLNSIKTLGFRGEALPSIASVSRLTLSTWTGDSSEGVRIAAEGGSIKRVDPVPGSRGTRVEVRNLFFNAPVRLKFLRSRETEMGHVTTAVQRQALARPSVHFRLVHNGRTLLNLPPVADLAGRISSLYGREALSRMAPIEIVKGGLRLRGFASFPSMTRAGRHHVHLFINGRYVSDRLVGRAVLDAYRGVIPRERYPVVILYLGMDPSAVDVNVHPAKMEVRFSAGREVYQVVMEGLRLALSGLEMESPPPAPSAVPRPRDSGWEGARPVAAPQPAPWGAQFPRAARMPFAGSPATEMALRFRLPGDFTILGQYDNTFILLDTPGGLMIVDQHTAHERVLFERIMRSFSNGRVDAQELLFPVSLELTPGENLILKEERGRMDRLGFRVEPFGSSSFVLRSAPAILKDSDPEATLRDILDLLGDGGRRVPFTRVAERIIYVMACGGAVKAHQPLTREEMESILRALEGLEVNNTCPHGRPVSILLEKEEILRRFMRK